MIGHLWPVVLIHHPGILLGVVQGVAMGHVWWFPPLRGKQVAR